MSAGKGQEPARLGRGGPAEIIRHLGRLLRHHVDGRRGAAGAPTPPRPAAIEIVALGDETDVSTAR